MKLVTLDRGGLPLPGVVIGEEVLIFRLATAELGLAGWVPDTMIGLLEGGEAALDIVRRLIEPIADGQQDPTERLRSCGALIPLSETRLLAPVPEPRLFLSTGLAYREHVGEMRGPKLTTPAGSVRAISSITGPDAPIVLPRRFPGMVDIEVELSVVISSPAYDVGVENAMRCVAGYTLYNDVSARDWNAERDFDLIRQGKQFPTFSPLGPWIVTSDELPDPYDVDVRSTINGKVLQSDNTSNLLFTIAEVIAHFSKWYRFLPGDIVTTGSPGGVGWAQDPQIFLKPGDVVTVEADGVGVLRNPVVAAP